MLTLPIKKQWFDMILAGDKKEEYRDIKPYYATRLMPLFGVFWNDSKCTLVKGNGVVHDTVPILFRNGYRKDSPTLKAMCCLSTGFGKKEWGAEEGKRYFILGIDEIEIIN